jgi:hypothetical protein
MDATSYSKDYFTRLGQNKDVFIYGLMFGALASYFVFKMRKK